MNKQEFTEALAQRLDSSKAEGGRIVDAILDTIIETLGDREEVTLPGFGKFVAQKRRARDANDPQNPGRTIRISASYVPKFRPGNSLRRVVHDSLPPRPTRGSPVAAVADGGTNGRSRSVGPRSRSNSDWRPLAQR